MDNARVEQDEVFVMGRGDDGELDYASGLYRATADLDLDALHETFMADDRVLRLRDVPVLVGDFAEYDENRAERNFQAWLLREGHVERVACKRVLLSSHLVRKKDGTGVDRVMEIEVDDPFPGTSDVPLPSPRR